MIMHRTYVKYLLRNAKIQTGPSKTNTKFDAKLLCYDVTST